MVVLRKDSNGGHSGKGGVVLGSALGETQETVGRVAGRAYEDEGRREKKDQKKSETVSTHPVKLGTWQREDREDGVGANAHRRQRRALEFGSAQRGIKEALPPKGSCTASSTGKRPKQEECSEQKRRARNNGR